MNIEPVIPAVTAAGIPSLLLGILLWWVDRRDKKSDAGKTQDQLKRDALDKLSANLTAQQAAQVEELRAELREAKVELVETKKDRDRGWDLARYWHGALHDLLRLYRNLRHNALNMEQWIGFVLARVPDLPEPTSMDAVPEVPAYPMGLEDPLAAHERK